MGAMLELSDILKEETIVVLKQLDLFLDRIILNEPNGVLGKEIDSYELRPSNFNFMGLRGLEDVYLIEEFLQRNKINLKIDFDFTNDSPLSYVTPEGNLDENAVFATLAGSPTELKEKVQKLINNLSTNKITKGNVKITYNIKIGKFVFDGKDTVIVDGKQKNVSDCLVGAGEYEKVSWDAINEKITGDVGEVLNKIEEQVAKKSINGIVGKINKKMQRYLGFEKPLIDFKENQYWVQYKVTKGD